MRVARALALAGVALGVFVPFTPSARAATSSTPATRALDYLHASQVGSGGFGRGTEAPELTPWAMPAVVAAGEDPGAALSFKATSLEYANHSVRLTVADKVGNTTTARHTFAVAAPDSSGPASQPDSGGASGSDAGSAAGDPSPGGSTSSSSAGDSPAGATAADASASSASPTPSPSESGAAYTTPEPSPSGQPISRTRVRRAAAPGTGPRVPGGYIGGGLVMLLPVGALVSHTVYRRRMSAVAELARGGVPPRPGPQTGAARLSSVFSPLRYGRLVRRMVDHWWGR